MHPTTDILSSCTAAFAGDHPIMWVLPHWNRQASLFPWYHMHPVAQTDRSPWPLCMPSVSRSVPLQKDPRRCQKKKRDKRPRAQVGWSPQKKKSFCCFPTVSPYVSQCRSNAPELLLWVMAWDLMHSCFNSTTSPALALLSAVHQFLPTAGRRPGYSFSLENQLSTVWRWRASAISDAEKERGKKHTHTHTCMQSSIRCIDQSRPCWTHASRTSCFDSGPRCQARQCQCLTNLLKPCLMLIHLKCLLVQVSHQTIQKAQCHPKQIRNLMKSFFKQMQIE